MSTLAACLTAGILLALPSMAERRDTCAKPFAAQFPSGRPLQIDVRSGDVDVVGIEQSAIRVSCELSDGDRADEISIHFDEKGELQVRGGPNGDVRIRIEVPRQTNLQVRCPAGDLKVKGIEGDKDIGLGAGDLEIEVGDPGQYSLAEASVKAGELQASAFGVSKGGLFRSFKKQGTGKYKLKAHLGAGDIRLR